LRLSFETAKALGVAKIENGHGPEDSAVLTQENATRRRELGQFFTPDPLAAFMASLFEARWRDLRLLDAGAGGGPLTSAVVRRLVALRTKPSSIHVTAFEVDAVVVPTYGAAE
jgi:adenine-specific DNA-methyltransferase